MSDTEHEHDDDELITEQPPPITPEELAEQNEDAPDDEQRQDGPQDGPQPDGLTPEAIEKRIDKTTKAFETYTRRVGTIWEEDAQNFLPFNLDPFAPPGFIDPRNAGRADEETKAAAMEFLGFPREREYAPDPETRTCQTCTGEGFTATGSKVPGNTKRKCPTCKGYGYTPPPGEGATSNGVAIDFHAPVGEGFAPLVDDERDMWGEAKILPDGRENVNYGRLPQHKIEVSPWGRTAWLLPDGTYKPLATGVS